MADKNKLFPVFLKLENLSTVIVGGGYVGTEKLNTILNNSPDAKVKIVAIDFCDKIIQLSKLYPNVSLVKKCYDATDINNVDIVIAAVNDISVSERVAVDAKAKGKLVNVADKPDLCDFYLSSIVQKGNLKIAVSTNGKSPTVAKRLKEVLNDALPEQLDDLLINISGLRDTLSGDFSEKVKQLNKLTEILVQKKSKKSPSNKWTK